LLAAVLILYIWQWKNIRALYKALTTDSTQIGESLESIRNENKEELESKADIIINIKPPSLEQSDGLLDGTLDPDDVKESLTEKDTEGTVETETETEEITETETEKELVTETEKVTETKTEVATENKPETPEFDLEATLNECVKELYFYKVDIMYKLGKLREDTQTWWRSLPAEERTPQRRSKVAVDTLAKCYEYEEEADAEVKKILAKYRDILKSNKADTSILDEMWDIYCEEKESEKIYYLDKYLD